MLAALVLFVLPLQGLCSAAVHPNATQYLATEEEEFALVQVQFHADLRERQLGKQALTPKRGLLHGLSFIEEGQDCNEQHSDDLYRPIRQVLAEHPGVEGNCWFHFYASYLDRPQSHAQMFKETVETYTVNAGKGKEATLHLSNGEDLITHLDGNWGLYPYDDAMCYMMGWLKGQRLDEHVMDLLDEAKWREVTTAECSRLPQMVEGGLDENSREMTIGFMEDDNARMCQVSECLAKPRDDPCTKATLKDYVYHLYPKCLLDEQLSGASGQVAWCYARACVTEGNVIKHGMECWPHGLPF
mmetsp:Transcript_27760/g.64733  ORF Transcript_27760/g.64733 Transcript_27760/m.64733 type:complete len:300 (+) Transcript_27760:57-956(+)